MRCRMKPSPPKKPAPMRFVNAIVTFTPRAAHRNESFCAMMRPPQSFSSTGLIFPGNADESPLGALHKLSEQSTALLIRVEGGVHDDAFLHVHHRPGLGDHGLARIE